MNEYIKHRLYDVVTVVIVGLIFWAVYTGYVLMGTINGFYTNQCSIVQDQALEKAVQERLDLMETGVKE